MGLTSRFTNKMGSSQSQDKTPDQNQEKEKQDGLLSVPSAATEGLRDSMNNLTEEKPEISQRQKELLRHTWQKLQKKMDAVGVVTFLRLFETHPDTLRPFLHHINAVREIEMDEWYQEKLRVHSLRVMAVVEKTMHRLDCEDRAAKMLSVYGKRHCGYGVTAHMLDLMSESFIVSFQPALEDEWTSEVETAWRQLFKFIIYYMKQSYISEEDRQSTNSLKQVEKKVSNKQEPSDGRCPYSDMTSSSSIEYEFPIGSQTKASLTKTKSSNSETSKLSSGTPSVRRKITKFFELSSPSSKLEM